jgi:polyisoprenoid-binding protein YceI
MARVSETETDTEVAEPTHADPKRSRTKKILIWVAIGVVAAIALGYGAIWFYAEVLNDSPDALDESDLGAALAGTVAAPPPADTAAADTVPAGSTAPAATTPVASAPASAAPVAGFDGAWVATDASQFGYRVEEVLAGVNTTAVGRSNQIDGTLTIEGTTVTGVDVSVDVATITSDESRRDNQFYGRIMTVSEFPTATFVLTQPIDFGRIPVGDETITATATGDLTLRGVTNPVKFDVTAQTTDGRIGVLGSIPVLFSDYGIANPSLGPVTTEDNGLVEFVLVFERA